MLLRDLLISSLRRWYLVLAGLLLTAGASYAALQVVSPTYEATGSMVLVPPRDIVVTGDNPYLYLGGLEQALGVLQVKLNSPAVAKPLEEPYPNAEFEVIKDATVAGPIMQINTKADSPADAMALLRAVIAATPGSLDELQDQLGVPASSRIDTMVLAADHQATVNHKTQIRAVVVVVGGGLAGTFLAVGAIDRALVSRRRRRESDEADSPESAGEVSPQGEPGEGNSREPAASKSRPPRPRPSTRGSTDDASPAELPEVGDEVAPGPHSEHPPRRRRVAVGAGSTGGDRT